MNLISHIKDLLCKYLEHSSASQKHSNRFWSKKHMPIFGADTGHFEHFACLLVANFPI